MKYQLILRELLRTEPVTKYQMVQKAVWTKAEKAIVREKKCRTEVREKKLSKISYGNTILHSSLGCRDKTGTGHWVKDRNRPCFVVKTTKNN